MATKNIPWGAIGPVKKGLLANGFFNHPQPHAGAKLISTTKYYTTEHGGYTFYAYVYSYPVYKLSSVQTTKIEKEGKDFYDDTLDEILGGNKQKLGG